MSRARAAVLALGALAAIAVLAATVGSPVRSQQRSAYGAVGRRPARADTSAFPAPAYRIVGCRSHGAAAYRAGPPRRAVAIGFDDGPWTQTAAFVRMLERAHARATFFMIGRQIGVRDRGLMLRELRDGDALGDHTFDHPDLTRSRGARGELQRTIAAVRALSGYTPCVFRPPYGAYNRAVIATARSLGLATVLWDDDPVDWSQPGVDAIRHRVLAQVRPGSLIISHDGGGPRAQTLAAYPGIVAALRRRGYAIVTIPELLGFRPVYGPCTGSCHGLAVPRAALPRGALVRRGP